MTDRTINFKGLSHVDTDTGCWLWSRQKDKDGYGRVKICGKPERAHRASYAQSVGPIPPGLFVLHRCDNRPCVNPEHLRTGTHADNTADMVSRWRQAHGERQAGAKLAISDVAAIRAMYVKWSRTHGSVAIARMYGVARSTIYDVLSRKKWRNASAIL